MNLKIVLYLFVIIAFGYIENSYGQRIENLKSADKVKISGQFGISTIFYNVEGRDANRPNFSWMIIGNPVITLFDVSLPFSFTVSEQQRSFQQPFNKFGVSPSYKWAKLHLGYRNINFSKYTLGGHTMLGIGGEFNPGNFRLGFMYGRLMKPVEADPLLLNEASTYTTPSYKRMGLSYKLGYGTETNYVDLIFFKGHDVLNSIDTISQQAIAPAENVVLSLITKQKFLNNFEFYLEYANGIFTKDLRLDSVPVEQISGPFSGLISNNISTTQSNAIESYLGYSEKIFFIKLRFKQIDPGFRSLGAYYMQNNLRNITIEPTVKFSKNKYLIGSSLGFQRDNLKNTLAQQTNRTIWSLRFSGKPVKWYNLDVQYSNFDIDQQKGNYELDSLYEISQTTRSYTVTQNINLAGKVFMQNFLITLNNQKLTDKNSNTENINSYNSNMFMGSYMLSYIPLRMNLNFTYSFSHFELALMDAKIYGPVIAYSASLLKGNMNVAVSNSFLKNKINDEISSKINILSISASYRIKKKHVIKARYNLHDNNSVDTSTTGSYKETKGELGYSFIF
jgi:hypothetical protein